MHYIMCLYIYSIYSNYRYTYTVYTVATMLAHRIVLVSFGIYVEVLMLNWTNLGPSAFIRHGAS